MTSGSLSPRHGASSGCGCRNDLRYVFPLLFLHLFSEWQGMSLKEVTQTALPSGMAAEVPVYHRNSEAFTRIREIAKGTLTFIMSFRPSA